jgi:group II intron reverse transcriptase/maturase
LKKKQKLRNAEYYEQQATFDELYQKSMQGKKFNNLMNLIADENNILLAYRSIKNNDGSETAGADGLTIKDFENWEADKFIKYIQARLNNYFPAPVRRILIPKEGKPNETRPLGIPCMGDRFVQQCIKQILEPICEAKFHPHSYGFRPNRSTEHAIARAEVVMWYGYHYVVDIDIKGFFDNVNHPKLIKQMWSMGIQDKNLICVIGKMLKAEIQGEGIPDKGVPQGGVCYM